MLKFQDDTNSPNNVSLRFSEMSISLQMAFSVAAFEVQNSYIPLMSEGRYVWIDFWLTSSVVVVLRYSIVQQ